MSDTDLLPPFGFRNLGVTCYFNALVQGLLSCPAFIKEVQKDRYRNNPIADLFSQLLGGILDIDNKTNISTTGSSSHDTSTKYLYTNISTKGSSSHDISTDGSAKIWKAMIINLCQKKKIHPHTFMQGMECTAEGFAYLLETMEDLPGIQNLFMHRYKSMIHCYKCDDWVSDVDCMYGLFEVDPKFKSDQIDKFKKYHINNDNLNDYLAKQSTHTDADFTCSNCKIKKERFRVDLLVMVPEILVVMSKKFTVDRKLNVYTDFPERLVFNGNDDKLMVYEAVAQIEHSGGLNGGHYWAICKRAVNGIVGWFNLNDMNVLPAEFKPTNDTFVVIYHLK
jgi:ubiquitin C-terminal hydrolase